MPKKNQVHLTRTLHLIDIENLCGTPRPTLAVAAQARRDYLAAANPATQDHLILGMNHGAALNVGIVWKGTRLLLRSGPNGADEALLDVLRDEDVTCRFSSAVIGSGDGAFAPAAAWLASHGLDVTVVSRTDALAASLRLASHRFIEFSSAFSSVEAA